MKTRLWCGWLLGVAVCVASGALTNIAAAADVKVGQLVIEQPWTRATPGGAKVGVGYLAIINAGDKADRLLSASTSIAERVELHTMTMDNGIMRMRKLDNGIELNPQTVTELKPGGLHLMLIGLKQRINEGDTVPIDVTFEQAGKVSLAFEAAGIGAKVAPGTLAGGPDGGAHGGSSSGQQHKGSSSGKTMTKPKGSN